MLVPEVNVTLEPRFVLKDNIGMEHFAKHAMHHAQVVGALNQLNASFATKGTLLMVFIVKNALLLIVANVLSALLRFASNVTAAMFWTVTEFAKLPAVTP